MLTTTSGMTLRLCYSETYLLMLRNCCAAGAAAGLAFSTGLGTAAAGEAPLGPAACKPWHRKTLRHQHHAIATRPCDRNTACHLLLLLPVAADGATAALLPPLAAHCLTQ